MVAAKMRFALDLGDVYSKEVMRLARQLGCSDVVGYGPSSEIWEFGDLLRMKRHVEDFGLRLEVIGDAPPIEKIVLGLLGREQQVENFRKSLENAGAAGMRTIKPRWHLPPGWERVYATCPSMPTRGGATSRVFDYELVKNTPPSEYGIVTEEQMWDNLTYFLKEVLPTAEQVGVRLAFHPDDPPVSPLAGFARILRSVEAFDRMLEIVPSGNVGLLFCQGCFAEMGADIPTTIRHFGRRNKIFYVHFRDVRGAVPRFQEVFHDDGKTDMLAAMQAYYEIGFEGPMKPDHGVAMEGDPSGKLSQIFAIGYMKGLAECVEKHMKNA